MPGTFDYMDRAIELAAVHRPHPNPRVGAIVVDPTGQIVGEGAHVGPGEPHAEVIALREAGEAARGATMYVTLEPCSHHGRTPPCADALIDAGIEAVVVAVRDPDEKVRGRGIERLRNAGIEVELGAGANSAEALDPAYFHHRRTGMPFVTVKAALTLDGQMAGADGSSRWISDPEMRKDVAALRATKDALIVGAGTVLEDDPSLDLIDDPTPAPQLFVVAGRRRIPADARLLRQGASVLSPAYEPALGGGANSEPTGDRVDIASALRQIAAGGALDVMVEGGPTLISSLVAGQLVSAFVLYFGAKMGAGVGIPMFGGVFERIEDALEGEIDHVASIGTGLRVDFSPRRPSQA